MAESHPPGLELSLLGGLKGHHQFKHGTAYRQVSPTALDKIKNLYPADRVRHVGRAQVHSSLGKGPPPGERWPEAMLHNSNPY